MDAGEAEASAPGRGRQMASAKSRSSKEPPRSERTTEGATKPVSGEEGTQSGERRALGGEREVPVQASACQVPVGRKRAPIARVSWAQGRPLYQESGGPGQALPWPLTLTGQALGVGLEGLSAQF